jgi:beta-glucosidase/6-phospho-beta-glucosidase/beta-galactosidase
MFSKDFYFGASTAGFQVEMGSGKAIDPNTDWFVWTKDKLNAENGIVSGDDPAQGCDYWYNYKTFHDLAQNAGMNMLRIGVEWSRIFPKATFEVATLDELKAIADMEAVAHYREIMQDIKDRGIALMVNLNHFTLPLWLHDPIKVNREKDMSCAGWVDERSIHEFEKYAEFMVTQIDDLVDMWSTQNEPNVVAMPYNSIQMGFPPCIVAPDLKEKVLHNEALAHNAGFDAIKRHSSKPVGCIYAMGLPTGDEKAVKDAIAFELSRYLDKVQEKMDFLGLNYYSRSAVLKEADGRVSALPNYGQGCKPNDFSADGRITSDFGWEFYPEGLYNTLKLLHEKYGVDLYVTENGTADSKDGVRQIYLTSHMNMVEKLIEDGVPIKGYLHWSLVDNFEWASGYGQRFGLIHVNYETKKLTPRGSYFIMKDIIEKGTTKDYDYLLKYPYDIFDEKNLMK